MIDSPGASLPPPKRSIGCVDTMSAATTVHGNLAMLIAADFRVAARLLDLQRRRRRRRR